MRILLLILALMAAALYLGSTYYYYSPLYTQVVYATAVIYPTKGNTTSGTVTFSQEKDGLHVAGHITGLSQGLHGFHVHEFGNCACDDAKCAGDHFNPTAQPHGSQTSEHRHVGDFGNIEADAHGVAEFSFVDTYATLNGPHSIIGRTIIIHADPDDLTTEPSGNAGARVGCGVVGTAQK